MSEYKCDSKYFLDSVIMNIQDFFLALLQSDY